MTGRDRIVRYKIDCPACMAQGSTYNGEKWVECAGCLGEECHYIDVPLSESEGYDDGPAWDEVITILQTLGVEPDEDAWRFKTTTGICDDYNEDNDEHLRKDPGLSCHLRIETYPVSKAAAMNRARDRAENGPSDQEQEGAEANDLARERENRDLVDAGRGHLVRR